MRKRTNKRTTADTNIGGMLFIFLMLLCLLCAMMGLGALGAVAGGL